MSEPQRIYLSRPCNLSDPKLWQRAKIAYRNGWRTYKMRPPNFYEDNWQNVRLTDAEIDALCDAADRGDIETADAIAEAAYTACCDWPEVLTDE